MSDLMLDEYGDFDEERYMREYNFQLESADTERRCETCKHGSKHLNRQEKEYANSLSAEHERPYIKCLAASKLSGGGRIFAPIGSLCELYMADKNEQ